MVEDGRLGCPCGPHFVMAGHGVQQLGAHFGFEGGGSFLDQSQAEVDVAEQPPFLGLTEGGPSLELERAPEVVQQRGRQHQVGAQSRMQLRRFPAQRRHANRVLE